MEGAEQVREALERNVKAVTLRPAVGQGTAVTKVRLVRGELGVSDDVRPGYSAIRYVVRVESPAPEADVRRALDTAERYSSYRDDFANPVPLSRELHITASVR